MKVVAGESLIEGRGVFARDAIDEGESIFDSEPTSDQPAPNQVVMTDDEFARYRATVERYSARAIGDGRHIVSLAESIVDLGNHSCDPNMWLDTDGVTLVARRRIEAGDEVTSDYAFWSDGDTWTMACNCGAPNCRGVITGKDWQLSELQEAYRGHWPPFIADGSARQP